MERVRLVSDFLSGANLCTQENSIDKLIEEETKGCANKLDFINWCAIDSGILVSSVSTTLVSSPSPSICQPILAIAIKGSSKCLEWHLNPEERLPCRASSQRLILTLTLMWFHSRPNQCRLSVLSHLSFYSSCRDLTVIIAVMEWTVSLPMVFSRRIMTTTKWCYSLPNQWAKDIQVSESDLAYIY